MIEIQFFQCGSQVGNWSRWLTDLFDIDDGESLKNSNEENGSKELDTSAKSFYLLNALSDLMMLPKDMLLSRTMRKEVRLRTQPFAILCFFIFSPL